MSHELSLDESSHSLTLSLSRSISRWGNKDTPNVSEVERALKTAFESVDSEILALTQSGGLGTSHELSLSLSNLSCSYISPLLLLYFCLSWSTIADAQRVSSESHLCTSLYLSQTRTPNPTRSPPFVHACVSPDPLPVYIYVHRKSWILKL